MKNFFAKVSRILIGTDKNSQNCSHLVVSLVIFILNYEWK